MKSAANWWNLLGGFACIFLASGFISEFGWRFDMSVCAVVGMAGALLGSAGLIYGRD